MTKVFTCGIMFYKFDENLDHCLHKLKVEEYVTRNLNRTMCRNDMLLFVSYLEISCVHMNF